MATKRPTIKRRTVRSSSNPDGVWKAFTRMVEDPRFAASVAKSGAKVLSPYDLDKAEVAMLSKAAGEGLERMFEGRPGRYGKALTAYMGRLRAKVGRDARASLNDAAFRRFIDPLRLHAMHDVF